jgi:hypothetical protein
MQEYASEIARMYSIAKTEVEKRLHLLWKEGVQAIVVFGAAETGELIYSAVKATPMRIVGWVDNDVAKHQQRFEEGDRRCHSLNVPHSHIGQGSSG